MKTAFVLLGLIWLVATGHQRDDSAGNLLDRTIEAINRTLSFFDHQHYQTIDGILGTFVVQCQTNALIRFMDDISGFEKDPLRYKLKFLNKNARDMITRFIPKIFSYNPSYSRLTASLLNQNLWSRIQCSNRKLDEKLLFAEEEEEEKWKQNEVTEMLSDECLNKIFNGCQMSDFCWKLFVQHRDGYHGYVLAHQVLYLSAMETMKCFDKMKLEEIDRRISQDCYRLYLENKDIEQRLYPQEDQDLFMETVAFCSLNGFDEFRKSFDWLEKILSWQDPEIGCFKIDLRLLDRYVKKVKRRESVSLPDGCSWHKTSIAQISMSIMLQQLVLDRLRISDRFDHKFYH